MAKKKTKRLPLSAQYDGLLSSVSELLEQARWTSGRTLNAILTATYWEIGRRIVVYEQKGERRTEYGEALLKRLAVDLSSRFGRGYSRQNLQQMRLFYLAHDVGEICQTVSGKLEGEEKSRTASGFSGLVTIRQTLSAESDYAALRKGQASSAISQTVSGKFTLSDLAEAFPLPWSHYVRLLSVENPEARAFYEAEAVRGGWSVRQLTDSALRTYFLYYGSYITTDAP
jgi:DUF1016 N-terminal domain